MSASLVPPHIDDRAWTLRRAGEGDAERLALVSAATFLETYTWLLDSSSLLAHCRDRHAAAFYAEALAAGEAVWLAEAARGAPVGYAWLSPPDLPQAVAGDLELKRIYVLAPLHGTAGTGRALMAAAVDEARARGAPRLLLGLHPLNLRARRFYARSGFAEIGHRRFVVGDTVIDDDVVMAMTLSGPATGDQTQR